MQNQMTTYPIIVKNARFNKPDYKMTFSLAFGNAFTLCACQAFEKDGRIEFVTPAMRIGDKDYSTCYVNKKLFIDALNIVSSVYDSFISAQEEKQ